MKEKILIVEDEFIVANDLKMMLKRAGHEVVGIAASVTQAREIIAAKNPDWVLLDIMLQGDLTGIDLAWELVSQKRPFLYISANTNQSVLEKVKETEPYGFLVKPFREKDLIVMLDIARYKFGLSQGQAVLASSRDFSSFDAIVGQSDPLMRVLEKVALVAPTETSVLILGESGTGKERIAKSIHELSHHKDHPLVVVNCAALPATLVESELFGYEKGAFTGAETSRAGKFEQADCGTIFLDEIGELPLDAQVKLLRVLQEKEIERLGGEKTIKIEVRVIAATNRNLEKEVAEGRFRLDLYYRLNVFPITLPPLRDRREDLPVLAAHFLKKFASELKKPVRSFSEKAQLEMMEYPWPGNIRELEHLVERAVLMSQDGIIHTLDLPQHKTQEAVFDSGELLSMEEMEKRHILKALNAASGKVFGVGGAAELLKISPASLYAKMKKLGIGNQYN